MTTDASLHLKILAYLHRGHRPFFDAHSENEIAFSAIKSTKSEAKNKNRPGFLAAISYLIKFTIKIIALTIYATALFGHFTCDAPFFGHGFIDFLR